MKRIYISLLLALVALPMLAQAPDNVVLTPKSDMRQYRFYYIIPSGHSYSQGEAVGVNLGNGVAVGEGTSTTTSQTETLSSILMSRDYIRLPQIDPAIAEETMVVSYSVTRTEVYGRQITVLLQITDGKTHELACKALVQRAGATTGEALSSALKDGMRAILHVPACASPAESTPLSLQLGGDEIKPETWPEISLAYLVELVEQWKHVLADNNQLSEPFRNAYTEAMAELFRNPTIRHANDLSYIGKYAASYTAKKKEVKLDKRLNKASSAEDRYLMLTAHCVYNH